MRFPCLVVDHDDTVVDSTAAIHYPAFQAYLKLTRPGMSYTLESYFQKNFEPGFTRFLREELGFSEPEMEKEFRFWQEYVKTRIPRAYPGIREILERHHRAGGILAVVTHSLSDTVLRDYRENSLPVPDIIFDWALPPRQRKPNPWLLVQIMKRFGFSARELFVLDDLKTGYDMAHAANAVFAAAGWANDIPEIVGFMRENCDFYFKTVTELSDFLIDVNGYPISKSRFD